MFINLVFTVISAAVSDMRESFLVMAEGVMGKQVALLVVVSPRVKFHSEECC